MLPLYFYSHSQCVSSIVVNPVTCDSTCSAVIAVQFSGGVLPLSITLFDGTSTIGPFTATTFWQYGNLCPGAYLLTAIDANGDTCMGTTNFVVPIIPGPDAVVTVTNASCSFCTDGIATVNVTGGSPPYNYLLSNGSTTSTHWNLTPGTYISYVTDANGCTDIDTFIVGVGSNGNISFMGNVYYDINMDGIKDAGEPGMSNQQVDLVGFNVSAFTNFQGNYGIAVVPGTYAVTLQVDPGWVLSSTPASYTGLSTTTSNLDFGIYPDSTVGSAITIFWSGWPRCFWNVPYRPGVYNQGFTILNGVVTVTYDPQMTFVSSDIIPFSHIGNVLTYTYSNLSPGQMFQPEIIFTLPAGGSILSLSMSATGTDTFGYQFAETDSLTQTVTCSYDPNDKAVLPAGQGASNFVTMDTWLDYRVRFQNTGTDTAFTVVVIDTIDANLDLSTFLFMGSSHPVEITSRPGNEFTFTFNNILLPDSNTNEPLSHGYLFYRIKGNASNPDPTIVNNTAYIYFDLNSPVVTNTTLTTFSDNFLAVADVGNGNNIFELFPNPMENSAVLRLRNHSDINYSVTLQDIQGRNVLSSKQLLNGILIIEKDKLSPGTYILEAIPGDHSEAVYMRLIVK